ncbi:MAG: glutamine synthetase III [Oscillospiraceae bacterium]|jgi:glutamine synthetase|nr:glutamine synthetase III [Oscillospiraceae bacterium]
MPDLVKLYGSKVFNDTVMRQRLPKQSYTEVKRVARDYSALTLDIANSVAACMKEWAVEQGVTHFTHWFQPMTGSTAEKHESFISPVGPTGSQAIAEFSGKELVKGEPDASSFPSGGIRATFEARGYTIWDVTSPAFIKGNVLCIPTAFCSYSGEALDQKTPLLRSMQAINKQAKRVLKILGTETEGVLTTVGAEQEYFIVDGSVLDKRPDLLYTGRTLVGARPPRGQEMEDHYFGALKTRIAEYMEDLDSELWKLGVTSKTRHNEVAPAQHELAPIFTTTNIAADHNQLVMETIKTVARKHGLAALIHEKPFAGVNGSGKHNNWAIGTVEGENLLDPGDTPAKNARFLLFLAAIIKAVDEYQDLLRISVATAGNDHRLGANEAPPAIISMFVGEELDQVLQAIKNGQEYIGPGKVPMSIGVDALPAIPKDTTDRNRTSPFAFTGNKFEFRMPGSSVSISLANTVLNTTVAESLAFFADILEKEKKRDINERIKLIVRNTMEKHRKIIFNGNNYAPEWVDEAKKRGLLNLQSTVDALPLFAAKKNTELFEKHGVLTAAEAESRLELMLENYAKTIHYEALTLVDMVHRDIDPAVIAYETDVAKLAKTLKDLGIPSENEISLLKKLTGLGGASAKALAKLEEAVVAAESDGNTLDIAVRYRKEVFTSMQELRAIVDELEMLVASKHWPYPTYGEILYGVR